MVCAISMTIAEDGIIVQCQQQLAPDQKFVREKHPATPMKHIEEALELIGRKLAGLGWACNVNIRHE